MNTASHAPLPWIKICGLTQVDNALEVAASGADAIGLVFFEKSPRNVTPDQAGQICTALPASVKTIGVFVNESYDAIMEKVGRCGLSGVQLHGNEPPGLVEKLVKEDLVVIKALFAAKTPFLTQSREYENADYVLVEYGKGNLPGGNAESWNYEILSQMETRIPVILAGGLTPENVRQAIDACHPAGVDISSGVEKSHGIKDIEKVKAFINAVRIP